MIKFSRKEHVFRSPDFAEIIKDTIRFFNGTPVLSVPAPEKFHGTGVYALYCISKNGLYKGFHEINRTSYRIPIYIGKAVPTGWRQARAKVSEDEFSYELNNRIREHGRSLDAGKGLKKPNFRCRFMILDGAESDLIGTVEAALIREYQPLWNVLIDGFGNHDPGKGRYKQAKSDWDVCHEGRAWAEKCSGKNNKISTLHKIIDHFMSALKDKHSND